MIDKPTIVLDNRDYRQTYAQLLARRPGYVSEWLAPDKSAGAALAAIAARYVGALWQRLNQAPDKNKLAFFDLLGLSLEPAQAARAPLVFQLSDGTADGNAPAGTAVAAPAPPGSHSRSSSRPRPPPASWRATSRRCSACGRAATSTSTTPPIIW